MEDGPRTNSSKEAFNCLRSTLGCTASRIVPKNNPHICRYTVNWQPIAIPFSPVCTLARKGLFRTPAKCPAQLTNAHRYRRQLYGLRFEPQGIARQLSTSISNTFDPEEQGTLKVGCAPP